MTARLFYLIGASGAGKDSVLKLCRERLGDRLHVAHRYITRPQDLNGENHVALTREEYLTRANHGLFAMAWQANGHCYGVGCEVDVWLEQGCDVLVNGSRGYLGEALERYGDRLIPVLIQADPEQLRHRLQKRGRESDQAIEKRIERAARFTEQIPGGIDVIDNNADLERAFDQLAALLDRYRIEANRLAMTAT